MSEYQYYEFVTIDRPLSRSDMDALREVSSRAEITSTCFSNVYNYGGFRGEPLDILTRYFDAMVYETNWGTRRLMLKLPRPAVDPKDLAPYCIEDGVAVHVSKYHVVLEMSVQEEGGDWIDEADSAQWMPSLVPLRAEILRGRRSAPYLAWLAAASHSVFEDEADNVTEPPVPPGLGDKSPALDSLADFLGLDRDLRTAAAERSEPAPDDTVTRAQLVEWLATVPTRDLHAWLARVALDGDAAVGHEVLQHHRAATRVAAPARVRAAGRTLRELFDVADTHRAQRKRSAAQATARRDAAAAKASAAAQQKRVAAMAKDPETAWRTVASLVGESKAQSYDAAMSVLDDLRALARRDGVEGEFTRRVTAFREQFTGRAALVRRLRDGGFVAR